MFKNWVRISLWKVETEFKRKDGVFWGGGESGGIDQALFGSLGTGEKSQEDQGLELAIIENFISRAEP